MAKCALTTTDHPFDPFKQFDQWFRFDVDKGYNCCALLDRLTQTSSQLSDEENEEIIERAIDDLIKLDFQGIYKKVKE